MNYLLKKTCWGDSVFFKENNMLWATQYLKRWHSHAQPFYPDSCKTAYFPSNLVDLKSFTLLNKTFQMHNKTHLQSVQLILSRRINSVCVLYQFNWDRVYTAHQLNLQGLVQKGGELASQSPCSGPLLFYGRTIPHQCGINTTSAIMLKYIAGVEYPFQFPRIFSSL